MNDDDLLRYNRQIMLDAIDVEGQQRLLESTVYIRGIGGLGCPAALYLAAAGVGTLVLNDDDRVDLANLQRQIAFKTEDIGEFKVDAAQHQLQQLNPNVSVITLASKKHGAELTEILETADAALDCTDNFSSRFELNRCCVKTSTPLISGAAIRFEGQLAVFTPGQHNSPCYNCLYADQAVQHSAEETCTHNGVVSALPGIIGSMQALETIKVLTGNQQQQCRILFFDGMSMNWQSMNLKKNPTCPTCGHNSAL
ncbi:MAG: molybdopterin-synthase adenylyltransferase MoeB [Gammaproteobacteria bacterium]|nr:molybdopterin-synthase adenylyltransferase MoeB [Gammaproteobacteria bacterium]